MSYETSKYINLVKGLDKGLFSSGIVDNIDSLDMAGYNTPYARNFRIKGFSVESRPGHQLFATLAAGSFPKGIGSYLRTVPANDRLIVRHNTDATHKLYTIDTSGTATSIATAGLITSDNRMRFLNVADVVYCMNGVDGFGKLSGTTYTNPTTVPASWNPSFAVSFDGKTVASGASISPNTIYFSVADNYEDFTSAGFDRGTAVEQVTGLASTNQALFYFTTNTIAVTDKGDIINTGGTISYNSTNMQTREGAVNHDGIAVVGTDVYYVTPSNSINKIVRGSNVIGYETMSLTDKVGQGISEFMGKIPKGQTDCRSYYQEDTNIIFRFFKSEGSIIYDICVGYDTQKYAFLNDTNRFFNGGVFFKGNNYTISCIEPKVFRDEYSYDDQGSAIPFEYRTKKFYVSGGTFKNTLRESRTLLEINELANVEQTIYIDNTLTDIKNISNDITLTWDKLLELGYTRAQYTNIRGQYRRYDSAGIGTEEVGTFAIGTEGYIEEEDMQEVVVLRTKGQLNKKGRYIQWIRKMAKVGARVVLKELTPRLETLPPEANNLTH